MTDSLVSTEQQNDSLPDGRHLRAPGGNRGINIGRSDGSSTRILNLTPYARAAISVSADATMRPQGYTRALGACNDGRSFTMSPAAIHPTALVGPDVTLGTDVEIGPYAVVESGARIGDRSRLMAFAYVTSATDIGEACEVHVGSVLGGVPQVRGNTETGGRLVIGDRAVIREGATIHRALSAGNKTVIGSDCMLLAGSHVAHDCVLGDGVTLANGAMLAGHVTIDAGAFLSGNVAVHQHVRIGRLAMIAGQARVSKDVPPYVTVIDNSLVCGVNVVGMRRAGMSAAQRRQVSQLYATMYRAGLNVTQATERIEAMPPTAERDVWLDAIRTSTRGLCSSRHRSGHS